MKNVALVVLVSVFVVGCAAPSQPPAESAAPAGPAPQAYSNLAQVMQAIPFPASNLIFDTQSSDPGAAKTADGSNATAQYSGVYGGWTAVENAAMALSETANLIMIPGRLCKNGRPVPLDQEAFRKAAQGLIDAGQASLKAAQAKDLDAMVEVSGTVSDACAACHEKYRDTPDEKDRCM
jgi:hypothetical protein